VVFPRSECQRVRACFRHRRSELQVARARSLRVCSAWRRALRQPRRRHLLPWERRRARVRCCRHRHRFHAPRFHRQLGHPACRHLQAPDFEARYPHRP
jgi:hypothetical protein